MKRRLLKLALLLFALGQIAATCNGTETGNPTGGGTTGGTTNCPALKALTAGSDIVVDDLISTLCGRIVLCGVETTTDTCFNALNGPDGDLMTDEFGLAEGVYTIESLRTALNDGSVFTNSSQVSSCEAAIGSVDCGQVSANVSASNFSGTQNFIPSSCDFVFSVPSADSACP